MPASRIATPWFEITCVLMKHSRMFMLPMSRLQIAGLSSTTCSRVRPVFSSWWGAGFQGSSEPGKSARPVRREIDHDVGALWRNRSPPRDRAPRLMLAWWSADRAHDVNDGGAGLAASRADCAICAVTARRVLAGRVGGPGDRAGDHHFALHWAPPAWLRVAAQAHDPEKFDRLIGQDRAQDRGRE